MSISKRILMAGCLTICLFLVSAFQIQQPGCGEKMQVDEAFIIPTGFKMGTAGFDSNGTLISCKGEPKNCMMFSVLSLNIGVSTGGVAVIK